MKLQLTDHRVFFIAYGILLTISLFFIAQYSKTDIHLAINKFHAPTFDFFFKYVTHLGDGLIIALGGVILLFRNTRWFTFWVSTGVLSGLIAQFLKKGVFGPMERPSLYFEKLGIPIHLVEGVDMHTNFTFPSGHSTAAFAMTACLIIMQKTGKWDLPILFGGVIVAFSRVYLSQHFLSDITAGSIIGVCSALFVYRILRGKRFESLWNREKPLITFSTK